MTTNCCLAGIPAAFLHESPRVREFFAEYLSDLAPAVSVSVTESDVDAECVADRPLADRAALCADRGYGEALALYRRFCHHLPAHGGFFLHAGFFTYRDCGIAVIAPSGVGKSTHLSLWRALYGDDVRVINGDKPLVRRTEDGRFLGYGAPLSGKEKWCEPTAAAPITHLLFLSRGESDTVKPMATAEAFPLLYGAALSPASDSELACLLPLLSELLKSVCVMHAELTPQETAALAVNRAIFGE